jgi:FixJ family two-component response regulator
LKSPAGDPARELECSSRRDNPATYYPWLSKVPSSVPGMSGVELLELLRARQIHTPAIFITASGERLGARMMQAGAATILKKPVHGDELLRWIAWACSGGARPDTRTGATPRITTYDSACIV